MCDFQIVFGNRTLKRIGNRTINKFIKVRLKFKIYKLLIFFHAIKQRMCLIFNFMRIIRSGDTNQCYFVIEIR